MFNAIEIILHNGKIHNIYNIGTNNEYSVCEIAEKLIKHLKPNDNINEWIEYIEDRNFNDYRYVLNSNILNKLGWKEETNFEIGLNKTIEWYKNNKNFFQI